jgi:pimeloyl-ACP methyl ester carboxylesterase
MLPPIRQDKFCKIDDQHLRYWEFGNNNSQTVVLLHGIGAAIECWETLIPILSIYFHTYALDFLGFGKSSKPIIRYSPDIYTSLVNKFIQHHDIEHFSLIGHSMGGGIALNYTVNHPQRVEKLVLLSSAGLGRVNWLLRLAASSAFLPILSRGLSHPQIGPFIFRYIYGSYFNNNTLSSLSKYWSDPKVAYTFASYIQSIKDKPAIYGLETIEKPCLVIWGKDDLLVPVKHACVAKKLLKRCEVHVFKGGHGAYSQKPQKANTLITDFLQCTFLADIEIN